MEDIIKHNLLDVRDNVNVAFIHLVQGTIISLNIRYDILIFGQIIEKTTQPIQIEEAVTTATIENSTLLYNQEVIVDFK